MHSDNLKSVLTQVAYSYYEELLKTYDVRDAKKVTYNMVLEVLAPFIGTEKERISYYSYLNSYLMFLHLSFHLTFTHHFLNLSL